MGKLKLSEEEKMDIMSQHNKSEGKLSQLEDKVILDLDITPLSLEKFKSQGVKPYYYDDNTDIIEITKPVEGSWGRSKPKRVYLLTPDEYETVVKMSNNVKEMIDLKLEAIKLYKQYIPAVLQEITKNK